MSLGKLGEVPAVYTFACTQTSDASLRPSISEVSHPLNDIDVTTPSKVAAYFPQNPVSIFAAVQDTKDIALLGLGKIFKVVHRDRNFSNTILAADELEAFVHSQMQAVWVVSLTHNDVNIRNAATVAKEDLSKFLIENFHANKELYIAFQSAVSRISGRGDHLTDQQLFYIKEKELFYKREGFHLEEKEFDDVKDLKIKISALQTEFLKNIDEDSSHIWVEEKALAGVPEKVLDRLEKKDGLLKVICDHPDYFPVIKYCKVEETRKELFTTDVNVAAEKNIPLLNDLIAKRDQLAQKLGYSSFSAYDIEGQMAKSPEIVQQFIDEIVKIGQQKAQGEVQEMVRELPEAVLLDEANKIKRWDFQFISEAYKNRALSVDEKVLQEYFSLEPTLQKLLTLFSKRFDLEFKTESNEGLWDPTTKMLAVHTRGDRPRLIGHVILDLFPREGKYKHGCCVDVLAPLRTASGEIKPAIATVIVNFTPPNKDSPSLLMHNEVKTLFHELGHSLHQLLGIAEMPTLCGYHVKGDFLEVPSQFMEEMIWDRDVLRQLGEHYQSKMPIPEELLAKKVASRNFGQGHWVLCQMVLASMSLSYFMGICKNPHAMSMDFRERITPYMAPFPENNSHATFRHAADPLYASKYYSYSWAQVYAIDVYAHILELEKRGESSAWLKYRREILERGGGEDPMQLLRNFLGREPSVDAYNNSMITKL